MLAATEIPNHFLSICTPGNRTLAVCTKLDLMDHGTDAMDILYGRGMRCIMTIFQRQGDKQKLNSITKQKKAAGKKSKYILA